VLTGDLYVPAEPVLPNIEYPSTVTNNQEDFINWIPIGDFYPALD